jgi:hypothetical protein
MQVTKQSRTNTFLPFLCKTLVAAMTVLVLSQSAIQAGQPSSKSIKSSMKGNAGTAFNLAPVFDQGGNPVFPWLHEVRGLVQLSNLGNSTAHFNVRIDAGTACEGGHVFCLSGTMTITTLAGDELYADVVGWADPDPNDPKQPASMNTLHYDVTITGGTGRLQDAYGRGEIDGAFFFCGTDCFCDSYAGVATWIYDGVLHVPKKHR